MENQKDKIIGKVVLNQEKGATPTPMQLGLSVGSIVNQVRQDKALSDFFNLNADIDLDISNQLFKIENAIDDLMNDIPDVEAKSKLQEISNQIFNLADKTADLSDVHNYCSGIKNQD